VVRILCKDECSSWRENVFVVRIDGCGLSFVWMVNGGELSHPKAPLKFRCELTSLPVLVGLKVIKPQQQRILAATQLWHPLSPQ